jgi:hypothetical protein
MVRIHIFFCLQQENFSSLSTKRGIQVLILHKIFSDFCMTEDALKAVNALWEKSEPIWKLR